MEQGSWVLQQQAWPNPEDSTSASAQDMFVVHNELIDELTSFKMVRFESRIYVDSHSFLIQETRTAGLRTVGLSW